MRGYGHEPVIVSGDDPPKVHQEMAAALDWALDEIARIHRRARSNHQSRRPAWPMLILRTPKGWTGPKTVDGEQVEGTFRAHQVPVTDFASHPDHIQVLEEWLRSYNIEELFDSSGRLIDEIADMPPTGDRRMSANPHANGGELLKDLRLPDFRDYAVEAGKPGTTFNEATRVMGEFLRDIVRENPSTFRLFGPDETASNRLAAVFDATNRAWDAESLPTDDHLSPDGRVMEVLSEHMCQGWLEGYLLTGRHGLFASYEAFAMVSASMTVQHAKWLEAARDLNWRAPISSLNILLTSTCWRNDHNGFSHQGPGLIDVVLSKKGIVSRIYLPPDANCLLSVADHCFRSRDYVNLIVIDKQPQLQWLDMEAAREHCARGASVWRWASNDA